MTEKKLFCAETAWKHEKRMSWKATTRPCCGTSRARVLALGIGGCQKKSSTMLDCPRSMTMFSPWPCLGSVNGCVRPRRWCEGLLPTQHLRRQPQVCALATWKERKVRQGVSLAVQWNPNDSELPDSRVDVHGEAGTNCQLILTGPSWLPHGSLSLPSESEHRH